MNPNIEKVSDYYFLVEPLAEGAERRRDAAELLGLQIGAGIEHSNGCRIQPQGFIVPLNRDL